MRCGTAVESAQSVARCGDHYQSGGAVRGLLSERWRSVGPLSAWRGVGTTVRVVERCGDHCQSGGAGLSERWSGVGPLSERWSGVGTTVRAVERCGDRCQKRFEHSGSESAVILALGR
ncbi:hypothetical protein WMY93_018088 [Mugilogobius chulae]|uniref:Uncharacterized protein n=1 Tax=Mugilogobius chulae TaxID=88201 RepID=A0AAW0NP30_9GOBI